MSTVERLADKLALVNSLRQAAHSLTLTKDEEDISGIVSMAAEALAAYRSTPADGGGQGVTPLTEEQIDQVSVTARFLGLHRAPLKAIRAFARSIERHHRIGTPASTGGERKEPPLNGRCQADRDGDCVHSQCPQLRDGEPKATGRHCPLDTEDDDA